MKQNIKIAKQLIKIAKELIAMEMIGDCYYRIMNEQKKEISINFYIDTKDRDKILGWFDAMLGKPTQIVEIAKNYGFEDMPDTMDVKNNQGMTLSICLKGNEKSDMNGLIAELKEKYHCNEIK